MAIGGFVPPIGELAWGVAAGSATVLVAVTIPVGRFDVVRWLAPLVALAMYARDLAPSQLVLWLTTVAVATTLAPGWQRRAIVVLALAGVVRTMPFYWPDRWILMFLIGLVGACATLPVADARLGRALTGICLIVSAGGVYAGPPDTEQSTMLAAALGVAVAGELLLIALRLGTRASAPLVGIAALFAWTAMVASPGRIAAFPGAMACLGVLLIQPVADLVVHRGGVLSLRGNVLRFGIHVAVVGVASRVAALRTSLTESTAIAGGALIVGLVAVLLTQRLELAEGVPSAHRPLTRTAGDHRE